MKVSYILAPTNKPKDMTSQLSILLDTVQTIAFNSDCPKQGRAILINANQLRNPQTDDRTRRAAFKALMRHTKTIFQRGKGMSAMDRDYVEQMYYDLQTAAAQDRSAK